MIEHRRGLRLERAPVATKAGRAALAAVGAAHWRDPDSAVRREARAALRDSQWSGPVIEAALDAVLWDLDETAAEALIKSFRGRPLSALAILPGNVVGPAIACAYCAAVAGAQLVLKAASEEQHLAGIVARQFDSLGPPLANTIRPVYWPGGDVAAEQAELAQVSRVVIFGEDATIADVSRRAPPGVEVAGYGDAYSVGFVAAGVDLAITAAACARDVCMFDQRGCMSPQTVYVEGDEARALLFAHALARALDQCGRRLPRATPAAGEAEAAAEFVRRLFVTALPPKSHGLDTVLVGGQTAGCPQFVVGVEPFGVPTCAGFGRIVIVQPAPSPLAVAEAVSAYGRKLDTLGCAPHPLGYAPYSNAQINLRDHIRLCPLGEMQRPPFGYRPKVSDFLENAP